MCLPIRGLAFLWGGVGGGLGGGDWRSGRSEEGDLWLVYKVNGKLFLKKTMFLNIKKNHFFLAFKENMLHYSLPIAILLCIQQLPIKLFHFLIKHEFTGFSLLIYLFPLWTFSLYSQCDYLFSTRILPFSSCKFRNLGPGCLLFCFIFEIGSPGVLQAEFKFTM